MNRIIRRHRGVAVLLLCLGFGGLTGCEDAPPGTDLTVDSIEVTQAIQTPTHTVPLVAGRATTVRVIVDTDINESVTGVTGQLYISVDGADITPSGGLAPDNIVITAPPSPDRANEDHTLNYVLSPSSGITASTDVDFRVELAARAGESDTSNNTGELNDITFEARSNPRIYFVPIDYTPSGLGLPDMDLIKPGVGDAFVRGIFPVRESQSSYYQQIFDITLDYSDDANSDGILDRSPDGNNLLSSLASARQIIVDAGLGASNDTFLYGWLAGNPISGNGLGQVNGFAAYGNTQEIRHQRTFAHELGHNVGLRHNSRSIDEVGWDTDARLDGNSPGNNVTGSVKPTNLNDIMRGGQLTDSAWVDTTTYNFFLSDASFASASAGPNSLSPKVAEPAERVLVVQGVFDENGETLLRLEPAFRFPWPSEPSPQRDQAPFRIAVLDDMEQVHEVRFNALVADDQGVVEGEGEDFGFFEVMVAVPRDREVLSLEITNAAGDVSYGGLQKADSPSEVLISRPQDGETLTEQTEIAWELNSAVADEQLQYQIAYSPDQGESWAPVAVDVPGASRSVVFDASQLEASEGAGMIRVFVSNGLDTTFDEVGNLSIP